MLHQSAKKSKLGGALRTLVHLLFVHRALQMLVQGWKSSELARAKITLIGPAIPSGSGGPGIINSSVRAGIGKQALRDEVICVAAADCVVDCLTINARHAGSGFEMDRHGGDCGE